MNRLCGVVDRVNRLLGLGVAWCALGLVLLQMLSVVARYVFGYGLIGLQEGVVYCHSLLFLLGAAWVLQTNQHVRVDIFYAAMGPRARRVIDVVGLLLFALPLMGVVLWFGWPYVARAWGTLEGSRQAGGLPAVYLLKTAIIVFAVSVALQALATALRLLAGHDAHWSADESTRERPAAGEGPAA